MAAAIPSAKTPRGPFPAPLGLCCARQGVPAFPVSRTSRSLRGCSRAVCPAPRYRSDRAVRRGNPLCALQARPAAARLLPSAAAGCPRPAPSEALAEQASPLAELRQPGTVSGVLERVRPGEGSPVAPPVAPCCGYGSGRSAWGSARAPSNRRNLQAPERRGEAQFSRCRGAGSWGSVRPRRGFWLCCLEVAPAFDLQLAAAREPALSVPTQR